MIWEAYLRRHIDPEKLRWCTYHGPSRLERAENFTAFDIVLTTYDVVASDAAKIKNGSISEAKSLYGCEWKRVVLDEGE